MKSDTRPTCLSPCREIYAEELICKMQTWTWLYSLSKEKLDAVSNSIKLNSVEDFFFTWRSAFITFSQKLSVILAKLGIDLTEIEEFLELKSP